VAELSSEDALRLNVMLVSAEAVRIDEHKMAVYGLTPEGEVKVPLHPTARDDQYLTAVREMLSTHALGSPRGYPVYLRRWARMGQMSNSPLDKLLMIGEPEAVVAVACAPNVTDELAARAWWCSPTAEVAQRMLENEVVASGEMGPVLAEYLAEFLPFETEPDAMLKSVRLILRPGLISDAARNKLWEVGRQRKAYRVGFLETSADDLPQSLPPRADLETHRDALVTLATGGNRIAGLLLKVLDGMGQTFVEACEDVLRRPMHQDIVAALFDAIGRYFGELRQVDEQIREMDRLLAVADDGLAGAEAQAVLAEVPALAAEVRALLALSHLDEGVLIPIFARTDAVGTLLRKKVAPVAEPLTELLKTLRVPR